jgi:hypothetical protein
MGGGTAKTQAEETARIQETLMGQYEKVGTPIVSGLLKYATGALQKGGLPKYVDEAYDLARTSATEAASARDAAGRVGAAKGNYGLRRLYAGSASALASEKANIATGKAVATISQRNQLLTTMFGGAAQATDLAAGFGNLTIEGLRASAGQPNQALYGALGATATGLRALLEPRSPLGGNPGADYSNDMSSSARGPAY